MARKATKTQVIVQDGVTSKCGTVSKYLVEGIPYNSYKDIETAYKGFNVRFIRNSKKPTQVRKRNSVLSKTTQVSNSAYDWKLGHEVVIFGVNHVCVLDDNKQFRYVVKS